MKRLENTWFLSLGLNSRPPEYEAKDYTPYRYVSWLIYLKNIWILTIFMKKKLQAKTGT
jgi:hypothetical protein